MGIFLMWERLHVIMFTYPIVIGEGGGARMNGHLSGVKIHVQTYM